MKRLLFAAVLLAAAWSGTLAAAPVTTLVEDNFDQGDPVAPLNVPIGWSYYQQWAKGGTIEVVPDRSGRAVRLRDVTDDGEIGICRTFPFKSGEYYRATVRAKLPPGTERSTFFLQISFFRPNERPLNASIAMAAPDDRHYATFSTELQAPPNATGGRIYIYSGRKATGAVILDDFLLQSSPEPIPAPKGDPRIDFNSLEITPRDMCIDTALVRNGAPAAAIVVSERPSDRQLAQQLNTAIREKTGVALPVLNDRPLRDLSSLDQNLIMIGSRDTNQALEKLYMRHQVILDARYPGVGGHVVRSIHNPFGDKFNVIAAGGSDDAGTAAAVKKLAERIAAQPKGKDLTLGYLADIQLPAGTRIPEDAYTVPVWDSTFGWNRISKNLALLYMTGEEKYAKEFLRLAFPSPETVEQLRKDDEDYDDARDPLVKPYHYRSIRMMLYWDMVEESPYFTQEQRVAVTKKFYEQLNFWRTFGYQGGYHIFDAQKPHQRLQDRHYLWEALSVYVVADYFNRYYPCRDSEEGMRCIANIFAPLERSAALNIGTMMWYSTFTEPMITYATLSGGRRYENNPAIRVYGETLLMHSDLAPGDWALAYAGPSYLGQLAYLLDDQAFVQLLALKVPESDRTFRLGQSYWPKKTYRNDSLQKMAGAFVHPAFDAGDMDYPFLPPEVKPEDVVELVTYRQNRNGSGDFLLLDTKYETGGRNPFHNFNIASFRLNGIPVLRGYHNQLHLYRNGIATGRKSFYSKIMKQGKTGATAFIQGFIPDFNDHDWTRTLILRDNRFLLAVDRVVPRTDNQSTLIENNWESLSGSRTTITPQGDFVLHGQSRIPPQSPQVPISIDSTELLARVDHPTKYFSGFLNCAGFSGLRVGDKIPVPFELKKTEKLKLYAYLIGHNSLRGKVRILLDGKTVVPEIDHLTPGYRVQQVKLWDGELAAGKHLVEFEILSTPKGSQSAYLTVLGISGTTPDFNPDADGYVLATSFSALPVKNTVSAQNGSSGQAMCFTREEPGRAGKPIDFATVLRSGAPDDQRSSAAELDGKTALLLPEPALLIPEKDGGFLLAETDHLFGFRVAEVPGLFQRNEPVAFDYDATSGKLIIQEPDGKISETTVPGFRLFSAAELTAEVNRILAAKKSPEKMRVDAPEIRANWQISLPGAAGCAADIRDDGRNLFAVAAGKAVELYDFSGKRLLSIPAPDTVGALFWWPKEKLLLIGCRNEKLLACSLDGQVRWEFTSEMAPELVASAKYYWFKSALPGIYALTAAELIPGEELLYVGSAGTVEVLDAQGKLRGRFWQTWGAVTDLAALPAAEGKTAEVLGSRQMGGSPNSYVIFADAKGKLQQQYRGMYQAHDGTNMGSFGFSSIGRAPTIPVQLRPDGPVRLLGAFNGSQNRLMLWDRAGKTIADAELGPGLVAASPRYGLNALTGSNSRAIVVCDLNGDGVKEILLAYRRECVIAFDDQLQTRWLARLPGAPTVMTAIPTPKGVRIAVGCPGTLLILDASGKVIAQARLNGTPTVITAGEGRVVVGTEAKTLAAFPLP